MGTVTIRVDEETKRLLASQAERSKESVAQVVARLARKHLAGQFWEGVAEDYQRAMSNPQTRQGIEDDAAAIDATGIEAVRRS